MLSNPVNRWWTVGAGAVGTALGAGPIVTRAVPVVGLAVLLANGWPRSAVSSWIAVFMFSSGLGLAMFGRHVSRYGVRGPSIIYLAVFGLSLASVSYLPPSQPLFLAAFFIQGIAGAAACAMPYVIVVCALFHQKRGLALGSMSTAAAVIGALLPSLTAYLVSDFGWRNGLVILAVLGSVVPIVLIALLVRTPKGVATPQKDRSKAAQISDRGYLRDRVFWLLFIAIFGISIGGIGLSANLIPLFTDRGLSTKEAAWVLSLGGLVTWTGRIVIGWALDRFFAPHLSALVFAIAIAGVLAILFGGVGIPIYIGVVALGLCLGGEGDLLSYLVSRYFPIELVSKVVGVMWLAWAWGGGVGVYIGGLSYDWTGSYTFGIWSYVAALVIAIAAVFALPAYRIAPGEAEAGQAAADPAAASLQGDGSPAV